jgi:hypothetical protein
MIRTLTKPEPKKQPLVMRPCTPTLIVRLSGTSTWENLGLVAAYNTVVRASPESACYL